MTSAFLQPAFISMPGGSEWLIIAMLGLLVYGKRLPEVARSLGRGVSEFKKGLHGLEDEIDKAAHDDTKKKLP
jgi:sec-independent protein translocase protein TatA